MKINIPTKDQSRGANSNTKLTYRQVQQIKTKHKLFLELRKSAGHELEDCPKGLFMQKLSKKYNVTIEALYSILRNKLWEGEKPKTNHFY